jgi:hypothetical protein
MGIKKVTLLVVRKIDKMANEDTAAVKTIPIKKKNFLQALLFADKSILILDCIDVYTICFESYLRNTLENCSTYAFSSSRLS